MATLQDYDEYENFYFEITARIIWKIKSALTMPWLSMSDSQDELMMFYFM
jgi:hypothetical protein